MKKYAIFYLILFLVFILQLKLVSSLPTGACHHTDTSTGMCLDGTTSGYQESEEAETPPEAQPEIPTETLKETMKENLLTASEISKIFFTLVVQFFGMVILFIFLVILIQMFIESR